ncbi:hypothetical protein CDV36_002020 [Fusarium kuroshium]|uniref:Uncharacterized protein n=2 Tax=Fusarium solani species complex TaxID=232080 RepID=A0A3M2SL62_9HYPO|nr:hypothetical protein CDV36_002020 [Fusarium kuroshium]RSL57458.1 hypothetical protein CEP51_014235 [Fusarium floridanum]
MTTDTDAGHVNGDSGAIDYSSMLLSFLHDTSSFSDRQVQIANGGATRPSAHELGPSPPNANTSNHNKNDDKSVDK